MISRSIIQILVLILAVATIVLDIVDIKDHIYIPRALLFSAVAYSIYLDKKASRPILRFAVIFAISELIGLTSLLEKRMPGIFAACFYICNTLYLIGYIILLLYLLKTLSFKKLVDSPISTIVMLLIGVYISYNTINIGLFTDVTVEGYDNFDNMLVVIYDLIVITVLILALLRYTTNYSSEYSLLFLIAIVFITFSEIIVTMSFYDYEDNVIRILSTILLVVGFYILQYKNKSKNTFID